MVSNIVTAEGYNKALETFAAELAKQGGKFVSIEDLSKSGVTYGFSFAVGDVITFPPIDMIKPNMKVIGQKADGSDIEAYSVYVHINKGYRNIPVGSFRRTPINFTEDLKDYPVNLEIIRLEDDMLRVKHLAGKTLKVAELVKCECTKFVKGAVSGTEMRNIPIFEIL